MIPFSTKEKSAEYAAKLKYVLVDKMEIPERKFNKSFLLLIDHSFRIKGKGAIITGTVV